MIICAIRCVFLIFKSIHFQQLKRVLSGFYIKFETQFSFFFLFGLTSYALSQKFYSNESQHSRNELRKSPLLITTNFKMYGNGKKISTVPISHDFSITSNVLWKRSYLDMYFFCYHIIRYLKIKLHNDNQKLIWCIAKWEIKNWNID
jgi:hypothetical protein